jgi:hypothetical protein
MHPSPVLPIFLPLVSFAISGCPFSFLEAVNVFVVSIVTVGLTNEPTAMPLAYVGQAEMRPRAGG